jgi:hypothetical protein
MRRSQTQLRAEVSLLLSGLKADPSESDNRAGVRFDTGASHAHRRQWLTRTDNKAGVYCGPPLSLGEVSGPRFLSL